MVSATVNSVTTLFGYDSEGRRVTKLVCPSGLAVCSTTTTGAALTIYVYDPAGNLAREDSSVAAPGFVAGTQYLVSDALGSTRLVTDGNGVTLKCYDYLPYGEEIYAGTAGRPSGGCFGASPLPFPGPADVVSEKFTGQERDAETGLDNFTVRYYSGAQGRFSGADDPLVGQDAGDPQSWNLYSYGLNNPFVYTDPTGHSASPCAYSACVSGTTDTLVTVPTDIGAFFVGGLGRFYASLFAIGDRTRELVEPYLGYLNDLRNNSNCATSLTVGGALAGSAVGAIGGRLGGTAAGGAAGTLVMPVFGTVSMAAAVGSLGQTGGALFLGAAGASWGGAAATILCSQGRGDGGGGKGERNRTAKETGTGKPLKHATWDNVKQQLKVRDSNGKTVYKPKGWMPPPEEGLGPVKCERHP